MSENLIRLDVREDLRQGREPFSKIMEAVGKLRPQERLLLVAPFEPAPLFSLLAGQGFAHESKQTDSGDWEVLLTRRGGEPAAFIPSKRPPCSGPKPNASKTIELDARGLAPPQPMIKILEAVASLPDGAELRARTDRRPMHLYAQLEERGFVGETEAQDDGSHVTLIHLR